MPPSSERPGPSSRLAKITITMASHVSHRTDASSIQKALGSYLTSLSEEKKRFASNLMKTTEATSRGRKVFLVDVTAPLELLRYLTTPTLRTAKNKGFLLSPADVDDVVSNVPLHYAHPNVKKTMDIGTSRNRPKAKFTCVIKDVALEVDDKDVLTELQRRFPDINGAKRIISRASNKPTLLVRVFTACEETVASLLNHGVDLAGNYHKVDPSNPPPPLRRRCTHCAQFDHFTSQCPKAGEPPVCPRCGDTGHSSAGCTKVDPSCPSCKQQHPAWRCPKAFAHSPASASAPAPKQPLYFPSSGPAAVVDSSVQQSSGKKLHLTTVTTHQLVSAMVLLADMDPTAARHLKLKSISHWTHQVLGLETNFLFDGNQLAGIHYKPFEAEPQDQSAEEAPKRGARKSRSRSRRSRSGSRRLRSHKSRSASTNPADRQ